MVEKAITVGGRWLVQGGGGLGQGKGWSGQRLKKRHDHSSREKILNCCKSFLREKSSVLVLGN